MLLPFLRLKLLLKKLFWIYGLKLSCSYADEGTLLRLVDAVSYALSILTDEGAALNTALSTSRTHVYCPTLSPSQAVKSSTFCLSPSTLPSAAIFSELRLARTTTFS